MCGAGARARLRTELSNEHKSRGISLIGEDYESMPSNWFADIAELLFWILNIVLEFLF